MLTGKNYVELLDYFKKTLAEFFNLKLIAKNKRKTLKSKAAIATFDLMIMRLKGKVDILTSGNPVDVAFAELSIQKEFYGPIIDYWTNVFVEELIKRG